ncbi:Gldg family protein [Granulosicoccaceae sp. 1_MG-2023]|nr:Gldg family protein [Granulosicoccaceae sp. 1_MG-2023]
MNTRLLARWQNLLFALLLAAICLLLGSYSQQIYKQWDLTASGRHSLSQTSKAVLALLDGPVEAIAVAPPVPRQRDAISALIARYQQHKADFSLSFINPETEPSRVEKLGANPAGELLLRYAGREQKLNVLSEQALTDALQRLARPQRRRVRFVSGHRERSPDGTINTDYATLTGRLADIGFDISSLSLVTQPVVPEDTDLLVIAAPRERYFPGEVASLLNYLSSGGNLLWLREPGRIDDGLKALEIELGVSTLPGVIIEANTQLFDIDTPTFAVVDQYPTNPVTTELGSVTLFPEAAALDVQAMQAGSVSLMLQTSVNSWTETGPVMGEVTLNEDQNEVRGPLTLGVTIERERSHTTQRIAVLGDADFMANTWIGNGGNQALGERLFNWLTADDSLLQFERIAAPDRQLNLSNTAVLTLAGVFLLGLPLLLFGGAVVVWRRARKG